MPLQKAKFVLINPVSRETIQDLTFMYNPSEIKVKFSPQYSFKSAALSVPPFAQYNNSEPLEISFSLLLRSTTYKAPVTAELKGLRTLCEVNRREPNFKMDTPPVLRLVFGGGLDWLERRPLYGVITDMTITAEYFNSNLEIYHATADITFKEAYFNTLNPTRTGTPS